MESNKNSQIVLDEHNVTNDVTLEFFTNPSYLGKVKRSKKHNNNNEKYKEEINFYKKRITTMFKDILKNYASSNEENEYTNELKEMHETFVKKSIHYFKIIDKTEIIQEQYAVLDSNSINTNDVSGNITMDDINIENMNMNNVNDCMMRKKLNVPSLDNYVVTINESSENNNNNMKVIPVQMEIDLTNTTFKTKGVKPKTKNKDKDKDKDKDKHKSKQYTKEKDNDDSNNTNTETKLENNKYNKSNMDIMDIINIMNT